MGKIAEGKEPNREYNRLLSESLERIMLLNKIAGEPDRTRNRYREWVSAYVDNRPLPDEPMER